MLNLFAIWLILFEVMFIYLLFLFTVIHLVFGSWWTLSVYFVQVQCKFILVYILIIYLQCSPMFTMQVSWEKWTNEKQNTSLTKHMDLVCITGLHIFSHEEVKGLNLVPVRYKFNRCWIYSSGDNIVKLSTHFSSGLTRHTCLISSITKIMYIHQLRTTWNFTKVIVENNRENWMVT